MTPEELARKWSRTPRGDQDVDGAELSWPLVLELEAESFLAGYQAGKEKHEAEMKELKANFTFCCEDKARLLQELAAKEASPWVSVKERLPEEGLGVFISVPGWGEILTSVKCEPYELGQEGYGWLFLGGRINSELVSHWMPLPPLPPEEKKSS